VIVDNLDVMRIGIFPSEADAPLIVDPNTVLAFAVSAQGFELIAWRYHQVFQRTRAMKVEQLPARWPFDHPESRHKLVIEEPGSVAILERTDHTQRVLRIAY
jgi:hypothetical protein